MIRNIYRQKQAGRVWNKYLHRILSKLGFVRSQVDECVYYRDGVMYLLYTDDSILARRSEAKIRQAIIDIERSGLKITIEGSVADFLRVHIQTLEDGPIATRKTNMSRPRVPRQHESKTDTSGVIENIDETSIIKRV